MSEKKSLSERYDALCDFWMQFAVVMRDRAQKAGIWEGVHWHERCAHRSALRAARYARLADKHRAMEQFRPKGHENTA